MPFTLAIETSNPSAPGAGVCLAPTDQGSGSVIGTEPLGTSERGSDGLTDAIRRLCDRHNVHPNQIDRVACSVGPGGYTALRIAVTTAKTLAFAVGARVIAVPTPTSIASGLGPIEHPILIALASKKDEAHLTVAHPDGSLETLGVCRCEALAGAGASALISDGHLPRSFVDEADRLGIELLDLAATPEACLLASMSIDPIHPSDLEPFYAREPDAVTQWRARHKKG